MTDGDFKKTDPITLSLVELVNMIYDVQGQTLKRSRFSHVSLTEVHVLEAISLESKPMMTHVAKRLHITIGSLTTSVNKLFEKGLLNRHRDREDKRVVFLSLTDEGWEVLRLHNKIHERIDNIIVESIPEDRRLWVFDRISVIKDTLMNTNFLD